MSPKVNTTEHFILFDIDSASIGGGLVRYGKDTQGKILETQVLFSVRKNITDGNEYPFEKFFDQTIKTFKKVAEEVHLQSLVTIDGIYINVSVPWMSAQKRIIEYTKEKPFVLSQELLDELIQKEIEAPLHHNLEYADHDVELIRRRTLDIYANGYRARNPIGKEMSDLRIHSLVSVISTTTKQKFYEVIEQVFHRTPQLVSNTFVNYQAMKLLLPTLDNAFIIDMSGEVTSVLVVKKDQLNHIGSIPLGTHHIVRSLRDTLGISIQKARSLIRLQSQGTLDATYEASLSKAMETAFRVWFKSFYALIDTYGQHGLLPRTMVFKTDNEHLRWCREYLLREDSLYEHMDTRGRVEMIVLSDRVPHEHSDDSELVILSQLIHQLK